MGLRKFPDIRTFAYNSEKTQSWETEVKSAGSGMTRTMTNRHYPKWIISTKFNYLTHKQANELLGFIALVKGEYEPFYFLDPEDHEEKDIQLPRIRPGEYQCVMKFGEFVEPARYVEKVSVTVDGTPVSSSSYTVSDGVVIFNTAPSAASVVKASYTYYFRVRFGGDKQGIQNVFLNFNKSKTLKLVTD